MTDITPWQERLPETPAEEVSALARIPLMAGDDKKMEYLSWRAVGFPVRQAAELVGVRQSTVNKWRRNDAFFAAFESDRLPELQATVGPDVIRLEFIRNMRLLLRQDAEVIWKAQFDREQMTDREWSYYRQIRKHYTPSEFLNLEKALKPEQHNKPIKVQLSFSNAPSETTFDYSEGDYEEIGALED